VAHGPAEALRIAARRDRVAALVLRGFSQRQIASELGLGEHGHSTVNRDVAACKAAWRTAYAAQYAEHVAVELARLAALEAEYWQAWERSLQDGPSAGGRNLALA
jgi:hypothetical protein